MSPGPTARRQRFWRAERILRRREFQAVFNRGRRATGRLMTVLVLPNGLDRARLGIVASRKLGGAVQRNRAKRLLRELFRRHKAGPGTAGHDIVVLPRRELLDAAFGDLEADYKALLYKHFGRASQRARP